MDDRAYIAVSEFRTLESIATPFSVNAYGTTDNSTSI